MYIFCIKRKTACTERKHIREQAYLRIKFQKFKFRKDSHCQLVSADESGSLLIICHVKLTNGVLNSAQLHNEISSVITSRITYFLLKYFCRCKYASKLFSECSLLLFFSPNSSLLIRSIIRLILVFEYTHSPNTYQLSVQIQTLRNTDGVISGQKDKSQYINSLLLICHGGKNKNGNSIIEAAYAYSNCTFGCTASNLSTQKCQ